MKRSDFRKTQGGFTLIEILVVIGIIAVLAAIVIIAVNPARQFAQSRDTQRSANLNAILNAVGQRIADNRGVFEGVNASNGKNCSPLPASTTPMVVMKVDAVDISTPSANLNCLVPTYISDLPLDPTIGSGTNTGYTIFSSNGRVTVVATELEPNIPRSDTITITR